MDAEQSKATILILLLLIAAAVMISVIPRDGCGFPVKGNGTVEEESGTLWHERAASIMAVIVLLIIVAILFYPDCEM